MEIKNKTIDLYTKPTTALYTGFDMDDCIHRTMERYGMGPGPLVRGAESYSGIYDRQGPFDLDRCIKKTIEEFPPIGPRPFTCHVPGCLDDFDAKGSWYKKYTEY